MNNIKLDINYQTQKKQIIKETKLIYLLWTVGVIVILANAIYEYIRGNQAQLALSIWSLVIFLFWAYLIKRIQTIRLKELKQLTQAEQTTLDQSFWRLSLSFYLSVIFLFLPIQIYYFWIWPSHQLLTCWTTVLILEIATTAVSMLAGWKIYQLISDQQKNPNSQTNPKVL
jgi:uncharacterized membrane protein